MASVEELLAESRIIELRPDDVLLVEYPGAASAEACERVKERIQQVLQTDRLVVVLAGGMTLRAIREVAA